MKDKKKRAPIVLTTTEKLEVRLNDLDEKQTQELAEYILQDDEMRAYLWADYIGLIFDWSKYTVRFPIVKLAEEYMACKEDFDYDDADRLDFNKKRLSCIKALQEAIVILGGVECHTK